MDTIKHLILPHIKEIKSSKNEMAALSYKMYDIILQFLNGVVNLNWQGPNSKLAMVGGIMINCEGDKTDRFLPLMFETRTQNETKDLFNETFKIKAAHKKHN